MSKTNLRNVRLNNFEYQQIRRKHNHQKYSDMSTEIYYDTLLGGEISNAVATKLYGLSNVEELDARATEVLRGFNEEDILNILEQFEKSELTNVQNKSAFLRRMMKTYRAKVKSNEGFLTQSTSEDKTGGEESSPGPSNEAQVKELLDRTGYNVDITAGQRKHGGS